MFFKRRSGQSAAHTAATMVETNRVIEFATDTSLEAPVGAVRTLFRTHRDIQVAYDGANVGLRQAQQEFKESSDRLAEIEAGTALGGETDRAARKAHLAARDAVEFAQARASGLKARLDASTVAVAEAKEGLRRAWLAWQCQQEKTLIEMYEKALGRFLDEIQGVLAGAAGMAHSNRLRSIVRGLYLPDPSNAFQNLANPTRLKQWETVPAARDLNQKLGEVAARVLPLIGDGDAA